MRTLHMKNYAHLWAQLLTYRVTHQIFIRVKDIWGKFVKKNKPFVWNTLFYTCLTTFEIIRKGR